MKQKVLKPLKHGLKLFFRPLSTIQRVNQNNTALNTNI